MAAFLPFVDFCTSVLGLRLTEGQRVFARVAFDRVQPCDLTGRERELALVIFGRVERFPADAYRQIVMRFGRVSGKSTMAAAYGLYRCLTADIGGIGPGDKLAVVVVSFRMEQAGIILGVAKALAEKSAPVEKCIVRDLKDRLILRRWDGREVTFLTVPKSAGGAAGRGFTIIDLFLDESEFIGTKTSTNAVITDKDVIDGAMARTRGSLILASTPWPAMSETARLFGENFGNPSVALCALGSTLAIRGDDPTVVKLVESERRRDARNALREYDCIISDAEGLFFEQSTIEAASKTPIKAQGFKGTAGIDLAFVGDSSGLVVIERQGDKIAVVHVDIRTPKPDRPLVPSEVMTDFAAAVKKFNVTQFASDMHYIEAAREVAHRHALQVNAGPRGPQLSRAYQYVRSLLREGKLLLPADPRLLSQLKSVAATAQPGGGLSITLPRSQGSGHCDLVPALVAAIWHDQRHGTISTQDARGPSGPLRGPRPFEGSPFLGGGGFQSW